MIRIDRHFTLDESELEFRATTAQGPGGQHVNRSQTRVELLWNVRESPSLSERQRSRILSELSTRISRDGVLRVSSQKHRSQARNREATVERLVELLTAALHEDPPRKKTKPSRAAKKKRVDEKKKQGEKKRMRGVVRDD